MVKKLTLLSKIIIEKLQNHRESLLSYQPQVRLLLFSPDPSESSARIAFAPATCDRDWKQFRWNLHHFSRRRKKLSWWFVNFLDDQWIGHPWKLWKNRKFTECYKYCKTVVTIIINFFVLSWQKKEILKGFFCTTLNLGFIFAKIFSKSIKKQFFFEGQLPKKWDFTIAKADYETCFFKSLLIHSKVLREQRNCVYLTIALHWHH